MWWCMGLFPLLWGFVEVLTALQWWFVGDGFICGGFCDEWLVYQLGLVGNHLRVRGATMTGGMKLSSSSVWSCWSVVGSRSSTVASVLWLSSVPSSARCA